MAFQKKKRLKQPTDYSYVKKTLYLNPEDPFQAKLIQLMELCPRREAKILGIIANEFLSENPILDDTPDLLKDYINFYNKFRDAETQPTFGNVMRHIREGETLNTISIAKSERPQQKTDLFIQEPDAPVKNVIYPEPEYSEIEPVHNISEYSGDDDPSDKMKKALAAFM